MTGRYALITGALGPRFQLKKGELKWPVKPH
jgi:hypothetical protein